MAISNPPVDEHIAACGLFCTNCGKFKKGKCQGCQEAPGFQRCGIRKCVIEKGITTCADCDEYTNYADCKKINNLMAKIFALIFRSDRPAALALLRDEGREAYLKIKRTSGKM